MKKLLLIIILILIICGGVAYAITQSNQQGAAKMSDKKVLVAYFSLSGNTKSVAEKIHSQTGGDIFRIEPVSPYPEDSEEVTYGIGKEQVSKGILPPIKNTDISGYDIIFVGTPVWWAVMAPPVKTFLTENNFEGKTIVPFVTHGGGGGYSTDKDMANLAKGARVLSPLVVYGKGNAETVKEITNWLNKLNF